MTAAVDERSAAHQAAVDDLERSLGPFDDPRWRADLALLDASMRSAAVQWAADARTLARLSARVPRSPGDDRGGTPWTSFVREVAVARRISDRAAHAEVSLALALVRRHPNTLRLLDVGEVPAHRARVLVEECLLHTDEVVAAVEEQLPPRLDTLTPTRIGQEIARTALRLDAAAAARKEAVATASRTAGRRSLADGQAEIVLTGPAAAVQRWWDALTDRARALKAAGDPRNLGALRFDLAVTTDPGTSAGTDLLLAALGMGVAPTQAVERHGREDDGAYPFPAPAAPRPGDDARCTRPVQANITVPAATALGLSDEPGWLDGYGWISAPTSRRLLTIAELRKACVAPRSGQLIDLSDRITRPRLNPTALRGALRGMVLMPHELRDVVTASQPQHDPSPALARFVDARDRFCDGPTGTRVPARRADTDHDRPWPTGPTAAWNLVSRAGRTHQLKHAGWRPVRDGTGTTWTSPAGQVAFAPAHHHPPDPVPPDAALPDPERLHADDDCLLRLPGWAHLDDAVPRRERGGQGAPDGGGKDAGAGGTTGATRHGWLDEPPF